MTTKVKIFLLLIIFIAAFLRLYKLDTVPPALNWDEVAAGYNAYTIANWGRDEWGKFLPLVFTSFEDDKHPIHIYITAPIVRLFGLSDFTSRFSSALIGVLGVCVIFFLAQILFKNNLISLLAALFLAVSPYSIHFSRGLWEANFAPFFFMLGLLTFYLALQKKGWLLNVSFLSFGLSVLSYHSAKIVVPPIILMLILLYYKDLKKLSLNFYSSILIILLFIALLFLDPRLLGMARAKQTQFSQDKIAKTQTFQKTNNYVVGLGEIVLKQYVSHFTPQYLFISGDQYPRNSVKNTGEFYKIDALFIIAGLIYLIKLRSRISVIILAWVMLSPLPSSLVQGAPNAARAIFMASSLIFVAAIGAGRIVERFKSKVRILVLLAIIALLALQTYSYIVYYFNSYPKKDAIEWQYGMKQIVEFVKAHPEYDQVYVTNIRSQPYIFFLNYLEIPLSDFLGTVIYTRDKEIRKYSLVSSFGNYYFGGWDPIESLPNPGVLYVLSPSQYDGLKHRSAFIKKEIIHYPDGGDAFFLVSVN